MHESLCRLSIKWSSYSVCAIVAPCGRDLNFLPIFLHHLIAHGLGQFVLKFWAKFRRGSTGSCKLNTSGVWKIEFLTNISLYFKNGTRCGYSYSRRRIGTRMQSVEWCHFQWLSVTANLDFKFTIFWTSNNSKTVHDKTVVTMAD